MIRIKCVSDQHREFMSERQWQEYLDAIHPKKPTSESYADICVIAGDLCPVGGLAFQCFREICSREVFTIYVTGNHDYYSGSPVKEVDQALQLIENDIFNLHILRTGQPFLGPMGRRFVGDTMWVRPTQLMKQNANDINDNFQIPGFWDNMPQKYEKFQEYINSEVSEGDIVVTHHLPSERCSPAFFRIPPNNYLQSWFVCDQEDLILKKKPALWIHGHTHSRCDITLGSTRIFCNPLGYMSNGEGKIKNLFPMIIEV